MPKLILQNDFLENMETNLMEGLVKCSRYAFGPNRLHYCGPDANKEIYDYIADNKSDLGLKKLLKQFETMYPYLRRIAESNGIRDPFDIRVVEAYWIGNRLLENVTQKELFRHLSEVHNLKKKLNAKSFSRLSDILESGGIPHHSFHVFAIWKRTGHEEKEHTIESIDSCRISWGRVMEVSGPTVTVERKQLVILNNKLAFSEPQNQRFTRTLDASDDIEGIESGNIVTIHWGVLCEAINETKVKMLERYTLQSMNLVNRML